MLSFFSDVLLLIFPVLIGLWYIYVLFVLVMDLSNLKKSALKVVMILASVALPFVVLFQFTPLEEEASPYAEFLRSQVSQIALYQGVSMFLAGLVALFRLHVFGGRKNVPSKAIGRINKWTFRDFFRRSWRVLFYLCALAFLALAFYSLQFLSENWDDLHHAGTIQQDLTGKRNLK